MFNNKFCKQIDCVVMGSPLGPALANIFTCSFEKNGSKIALTVWSLSPTDGMLMIYLYCFLFSIKQKFKKYLSSKHPNINFSLEKENDGRLSFLDTNIFREKWKLEKDLQWCLY